MAVVARRKILFVYGLMLAGIVVWFAAILLAPYLRSRGSGLAPSLYACFAPLCHQIPGRSFRLFGQPLAVCARCFGIYMGFLAGAAAYPWIRGFSRLRLPDTRLFLALTAPIAVDAAANLLRIWSLDNFLRFLTGLAWGTILPFYFMTGIGELVNSEGKTPSDGRLPGSGPGA
jgi:uncharacterized membrane protein